MSDWGYQLAFALVGFVSLKIFFVLPSWAPENPSPSLRKALAALGSQCAGPEWLLSDVG